MASCIRQQLNTLWGDIQPKDRNQHLKRQMGGLAAVGAVAVVNLPAATVLAGVGALYNAAVYYYHPVRHTYELCNPDPGARARNPDPNPTPYSESEPETITASSLDAKDDEEGVGGYEENPSDKTDEEVNDEVARITSAITIKKRCKLLPLTIMIR